MRLRLACLQYVAEMEFGILGFMAKGPAKSEMEKVADEDSKNPARTGA